MAAKAAVKECRGQSWTIPWHAEWPAPRGGDATPPHQRLHALGILPGGGMALHVKLMELELASEHQHPTLAF